MEVITIESEAYKLLLDKITEISQDFKDKQGLQKERWLDNQELCQLLKISKRTAQHYRDCNLISFSQVGNKLYYKLSDIEQLLLSHYNVGYKERRVVKKYFHEEDIVSFGNYLLSDKRKTHFENTTGLPQEDYENEMKTVHHADIENWQAYQVDSFVDEFIENFVKTQSI